MSAWETLSSRLIYSNAWLRVREDEIVRPDGNQGIYSVVEMKGGIGVVAATDRHEIYIVGQYRYAPAAYSWEIPKGAFESFGHAEDPLDTAKRELEEEVGLAAQQWAHLATVHTLMGSSDDEVHLFLAMGLSEGKPRLEGTEDITSRKVSFAQFLQMVESGEITDATSIAAVYLASLRLGQR